MGARGRKVEKLAVIKEEKQIRPNPPRGMTQNARTVWWRIVLDFEPGYFQPRSFDLLRAFCESAARHKAAVSELEKSQKIIKNTSTGITKRNPLFDIIDMETGRMAQLSTKLGLTVDPKKYTKPQKSKREGLLFGGRNFQEHQKQ